MFNQPSALQPMLPGEPTPEALHREEYFNEKTESTDDGELLTEPRLQRRARMAILLAAHICVQLSHHSLH